MINNKGLFLIEIIACIAIVSVFLLIVNKQMFFMINSVGQYTKSDMYLDNEIFEVLQK